MKLLLVDEVGTLQGTYLVGCDEKKLITENFTYALPLMYIKEYPMGAAKDLGEEILNDVLNLQEQGIK